jgi:putative ABC transport system ATP-binding protein
MTALIAAVDVVKSFTTGAATVRVLEGATLSVEPGELVLLMGPSGSGKTTLVSILAGLMRPTSGSVELSGARLSELDEAGMARVRRAHVGFIFQTYNLFPALTARDNVALAFRMRGATRQRARQRAAEALEAMGLSDRLDHRPALLSSGQKQRVAIARALAGDPEVVIGDEPTAALDTASAMRVMEILRARVTARSAIIVVTHDHRLEPFADRVLVMEDGHIVREERPHEHARQAS